MSIPATREELRERARAMDAQLAERGRRDAERRQRAYHVKERLVQVRRAFDDADADFLTVCGRTTGRLRALAAS